MGLAGLKARQRDGLVLLWSAWRVRNRGPTKDDALKTGCVGLGLGDAVPLHGVLNCLSVILTQIDFVPALFAMPDIPAASSLQLLP
jgi:hypothetical protein